MALTIADLPADIRARIKDGIEVGISSAPKRFPEHHAASR